MIFSQRRYNTLTVWHLLAILFMTTSIAYAQPLNLESDEYPIGMYSVEHEGHMKKLQGSGVTYVQTYALGSRNDAESLKKYIAYLDLADKYGLKVMFNLRGKHWITQENGVAEMMKVVNAVKDHPALGFWYLYDEPSREHAPEDILPYYQALKKATPNIVVAIVNCWTESWNRYSETLDLQMVDLYPIKTEPFPQTSLKMMVNFTDQALALGKPVIPIHQSFNWKNLAKKGATSYNGKPIEDYRSPNREELRFMCYSGLAQGVRGTWWWSFYHAVARPGYGWLDTTFIPVIKEFRSFVDLVTPAHKPDILARGRDMDMLIALYERGDAGTYLVMCNCWPLERPVARWMEGRIESATLVPWGDGRQVPTKIEKGRMQEITMKPWEVLVWKLEDIGK